MSGITPPTLGGSTTVTTSGESTVSGGQQTSSTTTTGSGSSSGTGSVPDTTTSSSSGTASTRGSLTLNNNTSDLVSSLNQALQLASEAMKGLNSIFASIKDPDLLAAIMIEMAAMQRQNSLDQRLASRESAKAQLEGQAAETREAAIKEIAAAAVAVVMAVVSFAVSIGGAVKMGKEIKSGLENSNAAQKMSDAGSEVMEGQDLNKLTNKQIKELERAQSQFTNAAKNFDRLADGNFRTSDMLNMKFQAVTGLLNGISQAMESTLRAGAKFDEAQGQILAANAQDTEADADTMKVFIDAIEELVKTALQFIQQLHDAEVEMMASASRL